MDHRVDDARERGASSAADAGRRDDRAPVLELDVDALLAQRRASIPGSRSALEIASTRSVPASICGANSASPLMPTDTCPPSIADSDSPPPEKRDVVDAPRLDADGVGDEPREDLVAAAGGAAAPRDRLGPLLERARAGRRSVRNGDAVGTASTSYSPVSRAIGDDVARA